MRTAETKSTFGISLLFRVTFLNASIRPVRALINKAAEGSK